MIGRWVDNELESVWKERAMACVEYYAGIFIGVLRKTKRNVTQNS
jgi:hypothetical protein